MEPRVVLADNAGLFTLSGTRTHLVGLRDVVVLDPGPADPTHLRRLREALVGAHRVTVVVTHAHADHSAGALPLAWSLEAREVEGVEEVRVLGPHGTDTPASGRGDGVGPGPWPLSHELSIPTDHGHLLAIWTPGHARPHFALLHEETGALFPGDLLLGEGNTAWVGSYAGCVADYLASLDRLESLVPTRLHPAHGPSLEDSVEAIRRFRAHRLRRLEQVAEVLAHEPLAPVDRVVDRVYGAALPPGLRAGARWSVHALLDHLGARPFPQGAPLEEG